MKRVLLFLATNLAIVLLLSIMLQVIFAVLGIQSQSMVGLAILSLVWGMGGAFISLALSKWVAKSTTGAQVIENPRNEIEAWLVQTVRQQAKQAGIGMPEVAIYDAPDINAFATGMNRDHALVAVSTGLLHNMTQPEAEAVLGHEISHIANGDMVTMTLLQGVLNAFVIFFARIVANIISAALRTDRNSGLGVMGYVAITWVLEIVLGFFASLIVLWFSRHREFRADAGGARLAGKNKMIAALKRLQAAHEPPQLPSQLAAFGIAGKSTLAQLLLTHPPLEQRIAALQRMSEY